MYKSPITVFAVVATLCFGAATAFAAPGEAVSASEAEAAPNAWFVQLSSAPAKNSAQKKALAKERQAFRDAAKAAGISFTERRSFDTLWNGFSVEASAGNIKKIGAITGVTGVWPVVVIDAPAIMESSLPDLYTAINMTGANIAQNTLGFTGAGVKVAIMDTGIDVDNADFGGDDMARNNSPLFPSARIAYGYDLVGDAYNADPGSPTYDPVPQPDSNPDDCQGHGSHVAGIVGANNANIGLKGVAPEVTFGAYRVFGCDGSTEADIMITAMEMALADGMDVLNMSIGSSFQWPQYPTAVAASNLVDRGMVVVASIGNSGTSGLYAAGAPGLGEKVIGTASVDNTHSVFPSFDVNGTPIGYATMTFSPAPPQSGTEEYVSVGLACTPLAVNLTGKAALISRGGCAFGAKAANAINAGAISVVIYNSVPGMLNGTLGGVLDGVTPVVGITQASGLFMVAQAAPASLTWTGNVISFPNATGGLISSFSSWGLSPDLALKPDLSAPGGSIYSSYPLEKGGHATLSGTSMASPHVAGAAALILQAKPDTAAEDVRDLLQNSADPSLWSGNPGIGYLDMVHRQGAGMIDIDDTILATTMVKPGKIATGESEAGPFVQTLTISNDGAADVTYDLSSLQVLSTGGLISPISYWTSDADVEFDQSTVTVPAGGSALVEATIHAATYPDPDLGAPFTAKDFGQYGGYIVLTPQGGGEVLRVPYAGFVGDYQRIVHMSPTANGFPWLARLDGDSYFKVNGPADWVYTMVNGDIPYFLVHFDHHPQFFEARIFDAAGGQPVHPVFNQAFRDEYLPRNSTNTGFFAFDWDGERIHSNGYNGKGYAKNLTKTVPDGTYVVELRALKANGDPSNPAHWETWTSPEIEIDRP